MDIMRVFVVSICRYDHMGDNFLPCSFPVTMVTIHDNSSNKQYNRSRINHLADWLTLQGECKQPQMGISHGDTAIQWILRNKHGDTTTKLVEICSSHNFFGVLEHLSSLLNCRKCSSKKNGSFLNFQQFWPRHEHELLRLQRSVHVSVLSSAGS